MLNLILVILFGIGIAYFAAQNTLSVPIKFLNYSYPGVPLYLVALGFLLFGIVISSFINLIDHVATFFSIHGKDTALNNANKKIENLQKENEKLIHENEHLKKESDRAVFAERKTSHTNMHPNLV